MPLKTFIIALLSSSLHSFIKVSKDKGNHNFLLYHKPSLMRERERMYRLVWVTNELLIIWLLPPRDCRFYDFSLFLHILSIVIYFFLPMRLQKSHEFAEKKIFASWSTANRLILDRLVRNIQIFFMVIPVSLKIQISLKK